MYLLVIFVIGVLAIALRGVRAVLQGIVVMGILFALIAVVLIRTDHSTPVAAPAYTVCTAPEAREILPGGLSRAEEDALEGVHDHCTPPGRP